MFGLMWVDWFLFCSFTSISLHFIFKRNYIIIASNSKSKSLQHAFCILQGYKNLQGTSNAARKVIEGVQYIADSVTSVSQKPTKMISDWMTDQIAPDYWVPNSQIIVSSLNTSQQIAATVCNLGAMIKFSFKFKHHFSFTI